jgi:hypothetical protein
MVLATQNPIEQEGTYSLLRSWSGRRTNWGTIDSPRGESIFVTGVPKSIMRRAVARLSLSLIFSDGE